jgi:hypothetical protein
LHVVEEVFAKMTRSVSAAKSGFVLVVQEISNEKFKGVCVGYTEENILLQGLVAWQ